MMLNHGRYLSTLNRPYFDDDALPWVIGCLFRDPSDSEICAYELMIHMCNEAQQKSERKKNTLKKEKEKKEI